MKFIKCNIAFIGVVSLTSICFLYACGGENKPKVEKAEIEKLPDFTSEQDQALHARASEVFASVSSIPKDNFSKDLIALGEKLYSEKKLSKNQTISCASCHKLDNYGVDNLPFSPGDSKELGGRNSPTSYYAFLHSMQFWDGRAADVEEQAGGPILNPVEHGMPSEAFVEKRLRDDPTYRSLFAKAFPGQGQAITFKNITKAIGAFERQLHPMSKFDRWLDGDEKALNTQEKYGLKSFMESGCITCHNGIGVGGGMMQKFGLFDNYMEFTKSKKEDMGRYDVTKNEADKHFFKVPGLRNVAKTYPYFHDGSVTKLEDAVLIMSEIQNGSRLKKDDVANIVAFLNTLTME